MKNYVHWFFLFFLVTIPVFPELLQPINSGNPLASVPVTDPVLLEYDGNVSFFLYIRDNVLYVERSMDNRLNYTAYSHGLAENGFSGFSDLRLFQLGPDFGIVFFKAVKDSREGIYALKINGQGELALVFPEALDSQVLNGTITSYDVIYEGSWVYSILFIKDGILGYTRVTDEEIVKIIIEGTKQIESMYIFGKMISLEYRCCGTYVYYENSTYHLMYFEIENAVVLEKSEIHAFPDIPDYRIVYNPSGNYYCIYKQADTLYGKYNENRQWNPLHTGASLTGTVPGTIDMYTAFLFGTELIILYQTGSGARKDVYAARLTDITGYSMLNGGNPLSVNGMAGDVQYFFLPTNKVMIGFIDAVSGSLWLKNYVAEQDAWEDRETMITLSNPVSGLHFYSLMRRYPVLLVIKETASQIMIAIHTMDFTTGGFIPYHSLVLDMTGIQEIRQFDEVVLLKTETANVLLNMDTGLYDMVDSENWSETRDTVLRSNFLGTITDQNYLLFEYLRNQAHLPDNGS